MKSWLVILVALTAVLAACSPPPPPTSSPATRSSPDQASPTPSSGAEAAGPATPRCPPRPFDATATLGPEFAEDIFIRDESKSIASEFVAGLSGVYADPNTADVCRYFTEQGWTTALAFDPRLRAVERGDSTVIQDHILRVAIEGVYDLRDRPPVVPLDIIFDIPPGSTTKDTKAGDARTSTMTAREGFHAEFMFDGHRWRVDRLGPISDDYRASIALPTTPPPGTACAVFIRDPKRSPFDASPDRQWCDDAGRGLKISRDQLVLATRYPCNYGHAAILHIGRPLGIGIDSLVRWEYVRDPANEFLAQHWITERYDGDVKLPKDAVDSGWTNGNIDLWLSPSDLDRAVYLVRNDTVERWPRATEHWGVIDCN